MNLNKFIVKSASTAQIAFTFVFLFTFSILLAETFSSIDRPVFNESPLVGHREFLPNERRISTAIPPFTGCPAGNEFVSPVDSGMEMEVLRLVNQERKKRGFLELTWNEDLSRSARYHAADMATENYFSHSSQDRSENQYTDSCSTFDRIRAFAPEGHSENIAAGQSTARQVMDSWMKSPGHKANILRKNSRSLGVGYYRDPTSKFRHYWVQNFGL